MKFKFHVHTTTENKQIKTQEKTSHETKMKLKQYSVKKYFLVFLLLPKSRIFNLNYNNSNTITAILIIFFSVSLILWASFELSELQTNIFH